MCVRFAAVGDGSIFPWSAIQPVAWGLTVDDVPVPELFMRGTKFVESSDKVRTTGAEGIGELCDETDGRIDISLWFSKAASLGVEGAASTFVRLFHGCVLAPLIGSFGRNEKILFGSFGRNEKILWDSHRA